MLSFLNILWTFLKLNWLEFIHISKFYIGKKRILIVPHPCFSAARCIILMKCKQLRLSRGILAAIENNWFGVSIENNAP